MPYSSFKLAVLVLTLTMSSSVVTAQPAGTEAGKAGGKDPDLFRTIAALDTAVFDAYNRCDLQKFGSFFTQELEFYHDNGGLTNRTRDSLVADVKKYVCGKVRRELVADSLEVYPLHGYGAVEVGVHRFTHPGRDDVEPVGEARFVQLWQLKDGEWRITRVISYDHHALK